MVGFPELRLEFLAWLGLAVCAGLPTLVLYLLHRNRDRHLLPPQRCRAVPWRGLEAAVVWFLAFLLWPAIFQVSLKNGKLLPWLYHQDIEQIGTVRIALWAEFLAFPFEIVGTLALLRVTSNTHPYQLGLTTHRLAANTVLGYLAWLVLTPLLLGFNYLVNLFYLEVVHATPEEHPLTRLAQGPLLPIEWVVVILLAVVVAPVLEELLFRGVVQGWLTRRSWGGHAAMAGAFCMALLARADNIQAAFNAKERNKVNAYVTILLQNQPFAAAANTSYFLTAPKHDFQAIAADLVPAGFILVMIPGYWLAGRLAHLWLPQPHVARAVYGTALLFSAMHSHVWPTPIPLFFLGLALGWLASRTQSLVGPMVLHALFNGVACVVMVVS